MPETLIETHNLVKQYGKFVAVNNVSFEVRDWKTNPLRPTGTSPKCDTIKF